MELVDNGPKTKRSLVSLGQGFANMHLADTSEFVKGGKYGFVHDNFIGATKQINTPKDSWIDFFRECRLEPQIRMASKGLTPIMKDVYKLLDRLDDLLVEPERPSLLHGDMWGGNHLFDKNGRVVLIDPAVYVGHAEADIAMTEMFNPFPQLFYENYFGKIPRDEGYVDRKDIYNLYHYLNHYNLFGDSYLMSVKNIVLHYS
jgi:fructosamine-3-kinase